MSRNLTGASANSPTTPSWTVLNECTILTAVKLVLQEGHHIFLNGRARRGLDWIDSIEGIADLWNWNPGLSRGRKFHRGYDNDYIIIATGSFHWRVPFYPLSQLKFNYQKFRKNLFKICPPGRPMVLPGGLIMFCLYKQIRVARGILHVPLSQAALS